MDNSDAFRNLGLKIVVLVGSAFSCKMGEKRLIDFFAVSPELVDLVLSANFVFDAPFATHLGMVLEFSLKFDEAKSWRVIRPQPLPGLDLPFDEAVWHQGGRLAEKRLSKKNLVDPGVLGAPPVSELPESVAPQGLRLQHLSLSRGYAKICAQIEFYQLLLSGTPRSDWKKFQGRGGFPEVRLRNVVPRRTAENKYACKSCSLWAGVRQCFSVLAAFLSKRGVVCTSALPKGPVATLRAAQNWRYVFVESPAAQEVEEDPWAEQANDPKLNIALAMRALDDPQASWSECFANKELEAAEEQKGKAFVARSKRLNKDFRMWLAASLAKGAPKVHSLIKGADAKPHTEAYIETLEGVAAATLAEEVSAAALSWAKVWSFAGDAPPRGNA